MAQVHDPYRVLGLPRGASLDEVKRAYRRLAKQHHPDSGGERTLARFLEIQAAYEQLVEGPATGRGQPGAPDGPRAPWQADTARADATRRAYGARARGTRARPAGGETAAAGGAKAGDGDGTGAARRPGERPRRERGPRKATLGSTSYDEAEGQPFDPDWTGASWYGTTSGTYWTLNPREYADPRKHGPEYQARARRRAGLDPDEPEDEDDVPEAVAGERPAADGAEPADAAEHAAAAGAADTADTADPAFGTTNARPGARTGWRPAAETAAGADWSAMPGSMHDASGSSPGDRRPTHGPPAEPGDAPPFDAGSIVAGVARSLDPRLPRTVAGRLGLAVAGGAPIALGLGWLLGELTGCGRFAASCDPGVVSLAWVFAIVLVAVLVLAPALASVATAGAVGALVVGVPATVVLTATGGARVPDASSAVLGVALVIGWLGGVVVAANRWRRAPGDRGPVS